MKNKKLQQYVELQAFNIMLSNPLTKTAETDIISSIKNYATDFFNKHYSEDNKVASVLSILTPGILTAIIGPYWTAGLLAICKLLGIDREAIFKNIVDKISPYLEAGKITAEQTENAVQQAINSHADISVADDQKFACSLQEAKYFSEELAPFIKISSPELFSIKLSHLLNQRTKTAGRSLFETKNASKGFLSWIISKFFTIILASAGFLIAEDVADHLMGNKSPEDKRKENSAETQANSLIASLPAKSNQQIFKVSPSYIEENLNYKDNDWVVKSAPSQIAQVISNWATEIYPDLKGKESAILKSSNFNKLIQAIQAENQGNKTGFSFIPKGFTSRKEVVDTFIDQVALAQMGSQTNQNPNSKAIEIKL